MDIISDVKAFMNKRDVLRDEEEIIKSDSICVEYSDKEDQIIEVEEKRLVTESCQTDNFTQKNLQIETLKSIKIDSNIQTQFHPKNLSRKEKIVGNEEIIELLPEEVKDFSMKTTNIIKNNEADLEIVSNMHAHSPFKSPSIVPITVDLTERVNMTPRIDLTVDANSTPLKMMNSIKMPENSENYTCKGNKKMVKFKNKNQKRNLKKLVEEILNFNKKSTPISPKNSNPNSNMMREKLFSPSPPKSSRKLKTSSKLSEK